MTKCYSCYNPKCEVCGVCHACYGTTPCAVTTPRTQKGLGLRVLSGVYYRNVLRPILLAQKEEDFASKPLTYPLFARPCPSTPKHGYIDSRVVKDQAEAISLLKETLADDPNGELMLCPFLDAKFNVIWTPGSLVIGLGNDGATAGKNCLTVPLAGKNPFDEETLAKAKVASDGWPFIEAVVMRKPKPGDSVSFSGPANLPVCLTQLRAGPKIEGHGEDYVPSLTEVQTILKADPKLYKDRDWEILIDAQAGKPGVVVWHPGGAMTDHFSIHAFTHQIPIIFGPEPKVGQVYEPLAGHTDLKFDPEAILKGLIAGDRWKIYNDYQSSKINSANAIFTLLTALHNATAMTGENSKWIGFATAIMLRAGVTALRGEARHLSISGKASPSREAVYNASFNLHLTRHRASINSLVNLFRYGYWPSSGFGGMKWAMCGAATVELFESVRQLAIKRDEASAAALVRSLNVAVNQAHNGGWWLNKFASPSAFTQIQEGHIPYLVASAPTFFVGEKIYRSLKPGFVNKEIAKIARWPETNLAPPKVVSAKLTYQPGIDAVGLKLTTRLLKSKARLILAPVTGDAAKASPNWDHAYLVESKDGYRVEIREKDLTLTLWEDEKLKERAIKAAEEK